MKQIISLNPWLYWFQKLLVTSGYIALAAIVAGADVRVKSADLTLTENLLAPRNETASPFIIQQCSAENQLSEKKYQIENGNMCIEKRRPDRKNTNQNT